MNFPTDFDNRIIAKAEKLSLDPVFLMAVVITIANAKLKGGFTLNAENIAKLNVDVTYAFVNSMAATYKVVYPQTVIPLSDERYRALPQLSTGSVKPNIDEILTVVSGDDVICEYHLNAATDAMRYMSTVHAMFPSTLYSLAIMEACQSEIQDAERALSQRLN